MAKSSYKTNAEWSIEVTQLQEDKARLLENLADTRVDLIEAVEEKDRIEELLSSLRIESLQMFMEFERHKQECLDGTCAETLNKKANEENRRYFR